MFNVQADADVYKVEISERGPARITCKVAPSKDREGNWSSSFVTVEVWSGGNNPCQGALLVTSLKERDRIWFEGYGKTNAWTDKEGKKRADLRFNATAIGMGKYADRQASAPLQTPDDSTIPF